MVALTTAVALAMGAGGWFVGARVQSPADAAAAHRAPTASLVTVPVERRSLTATVIARGTVSFGAPQPLSLNGVVGDDAADGPQLVTKAPTAGKTLRNGDVLLEVSGRPVFVFSGPVPMYRKLVRGDTGEDVQQLRQALRRLLPGRGLRAEGPYNDALIAATKAWYAKVGYPAVGPSAEDRAQLRQLEQAVTAAKGSAAGKGDAGEDAADTSDSHQALLDATADLAAFRKTYGVSVPSGEVLFLPQLPTRLDSVTVRPGAAAGGEIGSVTDPVIAVNGQVGQEDADLLRKGMRATLVSAGGRTFGAVLSGLGDSVAVEPATRSRSGSASPSGGDSSDTDSSGGDDSGGDDSGEDQNLAAGKPIRLKPDNAGKLAAYAGQSVKITIKVGATGKAVLTVPLAAVFTNADGQARVSVQSGNNRTRDVAVTTGLSTNGIVQITADQGTQLHAGDRVVVGAA